MPKSLKYKVGLAAALVALGVSIPLAVVLSKEKKDQSSPNALRSGVNDGGSGPGTVPEIEPELGTGTGPDGADEGTAGEVTLESAETCATIATILSPETGSLAYTFEGYEADNACCSACAAGLLQAYSCGNEVTHEFTCCNADLTECQGTTYGSLSPSGDLAQLVLTRGINNRGQAVAEVSNQGELLSLEGCLFDEAVLRMDLTCIPESEVTILPDEPEEPGAVEEEEEAEDDGIMADHNGVMRELLWADEFDGVELNEDIWEYELGNGCLEGTCTGGIDWPIDSAQCTAGACGHGNRELQSYEKANVALEDGVLKLTARKEHDGNASFLPNGSPLSSGRIQTHGDFLLQYGRIEVKAKLPKGRGAWPTIFLLPNAYEYGGWPGSGELDILEAYNSEYGDANSVLGTTHFGYPQYPVSLGAKGQNGCVLKNDYASYADDEYHIFAVDWAPRSIKWYVDRQLYCEVTQFWAGTAQDNPLAPFDKPFTLILSLAMGGDLPGTVFASLIDDDLFPMEYALDYVRVFKLTDEEMDWVPDDDGAVLEPRPVTESAGEPFMTDIAGDLSPLLMSVGSTRIDAEYFDKGGEGVGYHDLDPEVNYGNSRLRPYDGVDMYEGNIWLCPTCWKFADGSGAHIQLNAGEWTSYTVDYPYPLDNLYIVMRHSSLTGGGFKIIMDSLNCDDPTVDGGSVVLDVAGVKQTYNPPQQPPGNLNIPQFCWQTEAWGPDDGVTPIPWGVHKLLLCSKGDGLNVTYMDFQSFSPEGPGFPPYGPGC